MKKIITLKSFKSKSLNGIINVPGDKSISQRALMFGSLCYGSVKIYGLLKSTDVLNTLKSLKSLGTKIVLNKKSCEVFGTGGVYSKPKKTLDFGNSGTGVRLMMGMLSTRIDSISFTGDSSLRKRPMLRIIEPLQKFGANFSHNNGLLPIKIQKSNFLSPAEIDINIGSAQIKSAVILASLNLNGTTVVNELYPSRDHTEILLNHFGAKLKIKKKKDTNKIFIDGPVILNNKDINVPGDFSSAAFIIVSCLICKNSDVTIKSVGINFFRIGLLEVIKKMNGNIFILKKWEENGEKFADIRVKSSELTGCKVNGKISTRLIDEYPILFVAASFAKGSTTFTNLSELKFKESNRLSSMAEALKKSGVNLEEKKDSIKIYGSVSQKGGCKIKTYGDHRIAMSMLIFGLFSDEPIEVDEIKMIETSFPGFHTLMKKIGAKIDFI